MSETIVTKNFVLSIYNYGKIMITSVQNNTPFTARCPELKAGDEVCHIIRTKFPSYSLSKLNKRIDNMHNAGRLKGDKYEKTVEWWEGRKNSKAISMDYEIYHSNYKYYLDLMEFIKRHKIADCGQVAELSRFILKINGYNATLASINTTGKKGIELDHEICVFNRDNSPVKRITKDTIILDAWLGECDFAPKILKKYKEQYNGIFKVHGLEGPSEDFIYLKPQDQLTATLFPYEIKLRTPVIEKMRDKLPEFLIKESKYTPDETKKSKLYKLLSLFID